LSAPVLAELVAAAGFADVAIPGSASSEVGELLNGFPGLSATEAALVLIDPRCSLETFWLDRFGLHHEHFDGRASHRVAGAWRSVDGAEWATVGWRPPPDVAAVASLEDAEAAIVRIGDHVCPACSRLGHAGWMERRRHHRSLVRGGRVLIDQDSLHGITLVESTVGWRLLTSEAGRKLPPLLIQPQTPAGRIIGRVAATG